MAITKSASSTSNEKKKSEAIEKALHTTKEFLPTFLLLPSTSSQPFAMSDAAPCTSHSPLFPGNPEPSPLQVFSLEGVMHHTWSFR